MRLIYHAFKRSREKYLFAFILSSFPSPFDDVIDGNIPDGIYDGNDG